jgi:diaminohydroxyphosphoribosylaminopyrimidine deaminase/5-amino-6-(5-phosphoribosylamino)uracil reductase
MGQQNDSSGNFTATDERFLARALALAEDAAAFASPNPTVGCVIARGDRALSEGAHRYDARDHAEIVALKQAARSGADVQGATAYVTLEPCSHHGRTGPCADALIAAGIARCVVATVDPNPQVSGSGIAKMRAAGIVVDVLPMTASYAQQARMLNDAFAFSIQHGRPFVTLKAALSVDGMLAPAPATRTSSQVHWLTGTEARAEVQGMRHRSDAVLTGIGTVLADDPLLTDRSGLPRRRPLLRVVLDAHLRTPLTAKLLSTIGDSDVVIFCAENTSASAENALRDRGADIVRVPQRNGRLSLHAVFAELAARSVRSVLAEGGSALNAALLEGDYADAVALFFSATEIGAGGVPFAADGRSPFTLLQSLTRTAQQDFGTNGAPDSLIRGYLHDSWSGIA